MFIVVPLTFGRRSMSLLLAATASTVCALATISTAPAGAGICHDSVWKRKKKSVKNLGILNQMHDLPRSDIHYPVHVMKQCP